VADTQPPDDYDRARSVARIAQVLDAIGAAQEGATNQP
jgi:hypothetical protein